MLADAAPADTTAASEVGVRFYAGYPVESPSGEQIGALCIFDPKPRERADFDETMLRQLALLIEAELEVDAFGAR
jgi:GAF domain-containing protein